MEASRFVPSDPLKPFVRTFLIVRSREGMSNRLLPDTSLVAAFRLGGTVTVSDDGTVAPLPPAAITGIRRTVREVSYSRGAAVLLAIFSEVGAAAFIREPLHRLKGASVPLGEFFPRAELSEVEGRLAEAPEDSADLARFQSLVREQDVRGGGALPAGFLSDLAYRAGYHDQSHFIRDFKAKAGITPREFFASPPPW